MPTDTNTVLSNLRACGEARQWASSYPTLEEAWAACERGDWMLWLWAHHCGPSMDDRRRPLVGCCVEIARTVLPIFEANRPRDDRPRKCLDLMERYATGEAVSLESIYASASAASLAATLAALAAEVRAGRRCLTDAALPTAEYKDEMRALRSMSAMPDDYDVTDEYTEARAAVNKLGVL